MGKRILFIPPNPIERWLNRKIYVNKYVYLDRWSFVHLGSGMGLGYLLNRYFPFLQYPFFWVLLILITYEVFEVMNWGRLFRKESFKNMWWDVKIGLIGYWVYVFFIR